jgi:hypothetical protein
MSGALTWLERPVRPGKVRADKCWNTRCAGKVAGSVSETTGYLRIRFDGREYKAHRLAWCLVTGKWPACEIDHINRDRADNRFGNLREATREQNNVNVPVRSDNKSGRKGVSWDRRADKWRAVIQAGLKMRHLGFFARPEHGAAVYHTAAAWYHGPFSRVDDSYRDMIEPDKLIILDKIREKFAELHDQVASVNAQRERLARDVAPYLETRSAFEKRALRNLADLTGFWSNAA